MDLRASLLKEGMRRYWEEALNAISRRAFAEGFEERNVKGEVDLTISEGSLKRNSD